MIHTGAMLGSIMAFNVWFRIWPAQKQIITAIKNGQAPQADLVALAGLRSKHNTYMSAPLLWTMLNMHSVTVGAQSPVVLMVIILVSWAMISHVYKASAKIKGF
jgi:uncharacterized membrane protein